MAVKGIFWVSEQRLVHQAYTIRRKLDELEIEVLKRKLTRRGKKC